MTLNISNEYTKAEPVTSQVALFRRQKQEMLGRSMGTAVTMVFPPILPNCTSFSCLSATILRTKVMGCGHETLTPGQGLWSCLRRRLLAHVRCPACVYECGLGIAAAASAAATIACRCTSRRQIGHRACRACSSTPGAIAAAAA